MELVISANKKVKIVVDFRSKILKTNREHFK